MEMGGRVESLPPAIYDENIPLELAKVVNSLVHNQEIINNLIHKSEPYQSRLTAALFHLTECIGLLRDI